MRAIALRAGDMSEIIDIPNELKALQKFVGGYIEAIPFPGFPGAVILVDEEGKLKDKRVNRPIRDTRGVVLDWLIGDALVVGTDGEEFVDLTEPEADAIARWCRDPLGSLFVEVKGYDEG